ncbi:MAG: ABC transporter permease [Muribaculaceae bacterium]|nr:ABC transporter permease [Muribaculaceae bacterium]
MNYPLYIARRLSLSSGGKRQAPAVTVAIIAVALSIAVMIASISIVLGFKQEIRDKVVGFNSHISIFPSLTEMDQDNLITLTPSLKEELNSVPFIVDYNLQAAIPAILKTSSDFKGVYLKGLSGITETEFIRKNLEEGSVPDYSLPESKEKIVISANAARQLGLKSGDKIDTYFITDDVRVRRLEITGVYNSHFDQYDEVFVFGALPLIQQLGQLDENQGTYLLVQTDDFDKIQDYTLLLQNHLNEALSDGRLPRLYHLDNVLNQSVGYFSWLSLLDTNVVVVIILMMIVGCITLISGMLIIILEKKSFIGMMKALGAPTQKVRSIFVFIALKIAIYGLLIGNILILTVLYLQMRYHFMPLDADSYYIDFVPVQISWFSILLLNLGVIIVTYLVLILPSRFVSKISPAESMRAE